MATKKKALQAAAGAAGAGGAEPVGIDFDGTNDYLSRSTDLVGNADGKTFTFSFWVYPANPSNDYEFYSLGSGSSVRFRVYAAGSVVWIIGYNTSGGIILNASFNKILPLNTWSHFVVSVDLANTANRYVYLNDSPITVTWTTYSNTAIDFTQPEHYIGSYLAVGRNLEEMRLAGVYLDYTYRNLSIEANRRLFIDADGRYVKPPTTGIISVPMDDPEDPARNDGTGGNFTLNGTVARSGRGPNQYNAAASTIDGSNDFLSKTSLSYGSDGKTASSSVQFKIDTQTNNIIVFALADGVSTRAQPLRLTWSGTKYTVTIDHNLTTGPTAFQFRGTDPISLGKWYQVDWSVDLTNTANRHVLINGVAANGTWSDYLNTNLDFSSLSEAYVGAAKAAVAKLNGEIGTVWYKPNQYIDLSVDNPFYDTETDKPKYLGANGELPTGSSPLIYLPLRADDAGNNLGTGGDFTVNSGPYVGARGPSEYIARSVYLDANYLSRTSLTGLTDSKLITVVMSIYAPSSTGIRLVLGESASLSDNKMLITGTGSPGNATITFRCWDATGTYVINSQLTAVPVSNTAWTTFFLSVDTSDTGKRFMTTTDGGTQNWYTYNTSGTPDFSSITKVVMGQNVDGSSVLFRDLANVYFATSYIDFSQESNRLKFVDAFGYPVDLSPQIENEDIPTPLIYMKFKDKAELGANSGSGGDFTVNGTVVSGSDVKG